MSDMKCPVCNVLLDECGDLLYCPNDHCSWVGNKGLWQALTDSMEEHDLCHDALVERTKELDHTRKALEQSEICCTEWEKQALDYKAENIALSGDLERTSKALDVAVDALKEITNNDYDADWQNDLAQATLEKIKDIK